MALRTWSQLAAASGLVLTSRAAMPGESVVIEGGQLKIRPDRFDVQLAPDMEAHLLASIQRFTDLGSKKLVIQFQGD